MKDRIFNAIGKKIKENVESIRIKGQRIGLSQRLPGFSRTENGALWCTKATEDQALIRANPKEIPIQIFDKRG